MQTTVETFFFFCLTGLLSPSMPFPPQAPQGPMGFGQPRPPLMGYGGMSYDCTFLFFMLIVEMSVTSVLLSWFWPFFNRWTSLPPQPVRRRRRRRRRQRQLWQLPRTRWLPGEATQHQVRALYVWSLLYFVSIFRYWGHWSLFMIISVLLSWVLVFSPCTINHLRMSRGDPRNIIEYRDLDAPDDMDFF